MAKSVIQYLPEYEETTRNLQARIPKSLYEQADRIRHKHRWQWAEIIKGLVEKFVDDLTLKPQPPDSFNLEMEEEKKTHWK